MNRRRLLLGTLACLPLRTWAAPSYGRVRRFAGEVYVNDSPVARDTAIESGHTISTGADGEIWFTVGQDAFFLRPNSRLRLDTVDAASSVIDLLRFAGGAFGATFSRGPARQLVTPTSTIGIRGTGVYLEAAPRWTYLCTCFGTTEIAGLDKNDHSAEIQSRHHTARRIDADGSILAMPVERHTNEEMIYLEQLVGRPNPFF
jgi:hypothetical protein